MSLRSVPSVLLLASLAGAILTVSWSREAPDTPTPATPSAVTPARAAPTPVSADAGELSALRDEIDALWEVQAPPPAAPTEAPLPDLDPDSALAARHDVLAGRLGQERVDPTWAPTATADLQARLDSFGPAVREVHQVECRATLCRVELRYDPEQIDPNTLADSLGALAPWPANGTFSVDLGDERSAWVFLSREGYELPS